MSHVVIGLQVCVQRHSFLCHCHEGRRVSVWEDLISHDHASDLDDVAVLDNVQCFCLSCNVPKVSLFEDHITPERV